MNKIPYYVVDAFTDKLFGGNPAGVCILPAWLDADLMQNIARENNLSETAFVVGEGPDYELRWFTPTLEIELCGHATLGTAFILRNFYGAGGQTMRFKTLSGVLSVDCQGDFLEMNFPARQQSPVEISETMRRAVSGQQVLGAYGGYNLTLELADEKTVRDLRPDLEAIRSMSEYHALIVTARGEGCDFVSRFFGPNVGVDEDPVTGSSHTSLVPFWSERLGKTEMIARQLSRRGGTLRCRCAGDRVYIAGQARLYLTGEIQVD